MYPPLPCLVRLLPPDLDSNETAVLVGQSAYPVGNVRPFQHTKAARRTHFASYILRCKGESGGDGLVSLPYLRFPKQKRCRVRRSCSHDGYGWCLYVHGGEFSLVGLRRSNMAGTGRAVKDQGSTETDREYCKAPALPTPVAGSAGPLIVPRERVSRFAFRSGARSAASAGCRPRGVTCLPGAFEPEGCVRAYLPACPGAHRAPPAVSECQSCVRGQRSASVPECDPVACVDGESGVLFELTAGRERACVARGPDPLGRACRSAPLGGDSQHQTSAGRAGSDVDGSAHSPFLVPGLLVRDQGTHLPSTVSGPAA